MHGMTESSSGWFNCKEGIFRFFIPMINIVSLDNIVDAMKIDTIGYVENKLE